MAGTEGFKIEELDPLPLPLQAGDLVEVSLPRPGKPGKFYSASTPAVSPNTSIATTGQVGIFRFAIVEEAEALTESGAVVVTPPGLQAVVDDMLANRITVSGGGLTKDYTDGILTINGSSEPPDPELTGITWEGETASSTRNYMSVVAATGFIQLCAIANNATDHIMTSPDGVTWTTRSSGISDALCLVGYIGGNLVAFSQNTANGSVSADGTSWVPVTIISGAWTGVVDTALPVGAIAVSVDGKVMTSSDEGATWTEGTPTATNAWRAITYAPGVDLAVAVASSGSNRAMRTGDGVNWYNSDVPPSARLWTSVAWSPTLGLYVALSGFGSGYTSTSSDGNNWADGTTITSDNWHHLVWVGDAEAFVAIGDTNYAFSLDGITWEVQALSQVGAWWGFTYVPWLEKFCAVNYDGGTYPPDRVLIGTPQYA